MRAHITPVSSIHDIAETLASDLLAKFPAAFDTKLLFGPDIRHNFPVPNLVTAECIFLKSPTCVERSSVDDNSTYLIDTTWHLPIQLQSGYMVSLAISTTERSGSAAHEQVSRLRNSRFPSSLSHVHPTFGLHEKIARFAEQHKSGSAEGAALLFAHCLFTLADEQSPTKCLQHVCIQLRDVVPMSGASRTRATKYAEEIQRRFVNNVFGYCMVELDRRQYEQSQRSFLSKDFQNGGHRAFLALGSNLGNRVELIESAVREMSGRGLTVSRTSALYETKPMYLENQASFINGACEVCGINYNYR